MGGIKRVTDILLTALAPMSWGTTYVVATEFLPADRPLLAGALRALPAGLALMLVYRRLPAGRWWWRSLVLGTLNIGLFFALLFVSAYRLPGGVAATMGAVQPLIAALLAWAILAERPAPLTVGAALAGMVGVALMVLGPEARLDPLGVAAALTATTGMALATVLTRRWGRPVPLPVFTAWQLLWGGLLLGALTLVLEVPLPALTPRNLAGATYLTVVGTGLAYALWFRGIERIGTAVSFLVLLSPTVAMVVGFLALGQTLTPVQAAGGAMVLGSVVLAQRAVLTRTGSAKLMRKGAEA